MEAFVYCLTNLDNNKKYIGYHKGSVDDGYICSSRSEVFWKDWEECQWSRQIIAKGTVEECVNFEKLLLHSVDIYSDEWYNNNRSGSIVYTEEVRRKMSESCKGRKISEEHKKKISAANKGRKWTDEQRQRMSDAMKGREYKDEWKKKLSASLTGKPLSEEHKKKLALAKLGNTNKKGKKVSDDGRKRMSESKLGIKHSESTKLKMSEANKGKKQPIVECPHCGVKGGSQTMPRWHFDRCKDKQ